MESQDPIAGAPMAAIDEATARRMVVALAARPHTSSGRLLTLADNLDEAALHASEAERPKILDVARRVREAAPLWPDGMSGISPLPALSELAGQTVALPRCGDHVRHIPSGEDWVVAWAEGEFLAWSGWPEGQAKLANCEVTYRCTDEEHRKWVTSWAEVKEGSHRSRVLRLYGSVLQP